MEGRREGGGEREREREDHVLHVEADEVWVVVVALDVNRHVVHIPGGPAFRSKLAAPPAVAHASHI